MCLIFALVDVQTLSAVGRELVTSFARAIIAADVVNTCVLTFMRAIETFVDIATVHLIFHQFKSVLEKAFNNLKYKVPIHALIK